MKNSNLNYEKEACIILVSVIVLILLAASSSLSTPIIIHEELWLVIFYLSCPLLYSINTPCRVSMTNPAKVSMDAGITPRRLTTKPFPPRHPSFRRFFLLHGQLLWTCWLGSAHAWSSQRCTDSTSSDGSSEVREEPVQYTEAPASSQSPRGTASTRAKRNLLIWAYRRFWSSALWESLSAWNGRNAGFWSCR